MNFTEFIQNAFPKPSTNMVNDSWTNMASYCGLIGTTKEVNMENVAEHISELHALDYPRQERIRQRATEVVEDSSTAKKLQAWYPGWCKRPCFHDEYLQAFNSPHVELVDTDGRGIDRITEKGIEHAGNNYDLDLIIFSTGFRSPSLGSSAGKADIVVTGRNGLDMERLNDKGDLMTLHGVAAHGFPNIMWPGLLQAAANANFTFVLDNQLTHIAHIINETMRQAGDGKKPVLEPTIEAQEEWAGKIMEGAVTFAAMAGCEWKPKLKSI